MKHKILGQVFTPDWIVKEILDLIWYNNKSILDKYILEPSSWDWAFLHEIVDRYIKISLESWFSNDLIISNIEKYIYGFELDKIEYEKSIITLDKLVESKLWKTKKVNWNIFNWNTLLLYKDYISFFDFVVWNPPYIRIHNLDIDTRKIIKNNFIFSEGVIDIYLSFYEIWLKVLNDNWKLGYITPNSYLHNTSYKLFRKYLKDNKLIDTLIDFKSNKIFKWFSTYTSITILNKMNRKTKFIYKELIDNTLRTVNEIKYSDLEINDWTFANKNDSEFLEELFKNSCNFIKDFFDVQYWFATLRDKIYISKIEDYKDNLVYFNWKIIEKDILKKIVKWSTYKWNQSELDYIIFPYELVNNKYIPIDEN